MHVTANLDHEASINQEGRSSSAAEHFRGVDGFRKVSRPKLFAGRCIPCIEHSGDAEGDEAVADYEWSSMWSLRHFDGVLVLLKRGLVFLLPENFAIGKIDAGHDLFRIAATVNKSTSTGDHWR